jgi:large subunit ribosomal protein L29
MPIIRLKDIKGMSAEERTTKISALRAELARLKTMVRAGGAVENPARIRALRKTIAQILTIENEYEIGLRQTEEKPAKKTGKRKKKTK